MEGVPSVQALRKRIKKGTLQSVRVLHRDSIVVGVELDELARQYPAAFHSRPTAQPSPPEPDTQPAGPEEQPVPPARQPEDTHGPRRNPAEGPLRPGRTMAGGDPVAPDGQPDKHRDGQRGEQPDELDEPDAEQPEPRGARELQTVDVAIQGWREAREALEASRREHREEVTRTISSYENQLRSRDREREHEQKIHGAREARAVRWGRAAAGALLVTLTMGLWATERAGDRLATERFQAGAMTEQTRTLTEEKAALVEAIEAQGAELGAALEALDEAEAEAGALSAQRDALGQELEEIRAERERARDATRAALRVLGAR